MWKLSKIGLFLFLSLISFRRDLLASSSHIDSEFQSRASRTYENDVREDSKDAGSKSLANLPARFKLPLYNVATPYQGGTSQCLKYAMTGILEWLANKSHCNKNPRVSGVGDFSEYYTFSMIEKYGPNGTSSYFTDGPLQFSQKQPTNRGYVLDKHLRYDKDTAYWMTTHSVNGVSRNYPLTEQELRNLNHAGNIKRNLPDFSRQVLFSHPGRDAWSGGGIDKNELNSLKAALLKYKSPILFTYRPHDRNWWHSNMIVGFNEEGFIVQDSAFGSERRDLPKDPTGNFRRGTTLLPYSLAQSAAKHAAVYYLDKEPTNDPDCAGEERRTSAYDGYLKNLSGAKALEKEGKFEFGKLPNSGLLNPENENIGN